MKPGMKLLMLTNSRKEDSARGGRRGDYAEDNDPRMGYDGREWPESRFRDRQGREHYDNGRYAPMRGDTNIEIEGRFRDDRDRERYDDGRVAPMNNADPRRGGYGAEAAYPFGPLVPPVYRDGRDTRYGGDRMNRIGFAAGGSEMGGEYPMDAGYYGDELKARPENRVTGHAMGADGDPTQPLTRGMAVKWVQSMEGPDGIKGQFWSMEQTAQIMGREGYQCNPTEWYVVMNMMKRDYSKVASKLGVDREEFYAAMADAFLHDSDALPGKLMRYYQAVVRK